MVRGLFLSLLLLPGALFAVPDLTEPDIDSASAIIMETRTGKVLYEHNPDTVRYPASTTKIMTALLLIENADLDDKITAPGDIEKVGGSSMDLKPGERVSVEDMLYALLLRSANDGAHATAVHVAGSVSAFSDMMDERAEELGATQTDFNNPHGLNDDKHTTTARDLALIAKGAMENATFARIARTPRKVIRRSINVDETIMESRNRLLTEYSGNLGIKTGWTRPAGRCFVGAFDKGGYGIVTVVLKSGDWLGDTRELADWAYGNYELARVVPENELVGSIALEKGAEETVAVKASGAREVLERVDLLNGAKDFNFDGITVTAPVVENEVLGTATVTLADGQTHSFSVLAAESADLHWAYAYLPYYLPGGLLLASLAGGAFALQKRKGNPRL